VEDEGRGTLHDLALGLDEMESVAGTGSFVWLPEVDQVWCSPGLQRLFDLGESPLAGLADLIRCFDDQDGPLLRERLAEAATGAEAIVGDYRLCLGVDRQRIECRAKRVPPTAPGQPNRVIGTCRDVTDERAFLDELTDFAARDPLTGVLNRFAIVDRLAHALDRLRRHERQVAVLFVDVDRLKDVNDRHGHTVGDHILRSVGRHLSAAVRLGDSVGRYGGDEFVVICEDINVPDEALLIGNRIVERIDIGLEEDPDVRITTSVGVTAAAAGEAPDVVLGRSDAAMYEAKRAGGGRLAFRPPTAG